MRVYENNLHVLENYDGRNIPPIVITFWRFKHNGKIKSRIENEIDKSLLVRN